MERGITSFWKAKEYSFNYSLVLNPDTYLEKDCIMELMLLLDRIPGLTASRPIVFRGLPSHDGSFVLQNYREEFDFKNGTLKSFDKHPIELEKLPDYAFTNATGGCAFLIRIDSFVGEKLFCEDYFMYGEEFDLSYRMLNQKLCCIITKRAIVWHNHKWKRNNFISHRRMHYYMKRNRILFYKKYHLNNLLLLNLIHEVLFMPLNLLRAINQKDPLLFYFHYQGLFHGLKGLTGNSFPE